jgi:hypothetical protein
MTQNAKNVQLQCNRRFRRYCVNCQGETGKKWLVSGIIRAPDLGFLKPLFSKARFFCL